MDGAFAELLKGYRLAAGLTQEALAECAGLGVRSIQALERGESRPLRDTLRRLADALAVPEGERARFLAAGVPAPADPRPQILAPLFRSPHSRTTCRYSSPASSGAPSRSPRSPACWRARGC